MTAQMPDGLKTWLQHQPGQLELSHGFAGHVLTAHVRCACGHNVAYSALVREPGWQHEGDEDPNAAAVVRAGVWKEWAYHVAQAMAVTS